MTEDTITEILKILSREYSRRWDKGELDQKIETWSRVLVDITDEQGQKGLIKALEDPGEFMPPVGKFKQMCLTGDGSKSLEDDGAQAWALVMKNLNSSIAPIFKDTAIVGAINTLGGWVGFCESLPSPRVQNLDFKRKEFIDLYVICRNQKREFSPLPDRVNKFFQNGEERPVYRFVGWKSDAGKEEALRLAIQTQEAGKRVAGLLN